MKNANRMSMVNPTETPTPMLIASACSLAYEPVSSSGAAVALAAVAFFGILVWVGAGQAQVEGGD